MRASTLFALTIAILIGLGVAVAAKVSGFFDSEAPPTAEKEIEVLVAAKNIFAGMTLDSTSVKLRKLKPEEMEHYQKHKEEYLPTVVEAALLRISKNDILADQPILKDDLEKLTKPEPLHARIMPMMRAVSISVERDFSAGGMIQVGDWVDVLVTSTIEDDSGRATTRTATVVPRARVVAKRGTLWPLYAPLPQDKPIQFTLEVNPYRAALLEYVKTRGVLTLTPLAASDQKKLEGRRTALLEKKEETQPVHFIEEGTEEAKKESYLVSQYVSGDLVVNEVDLIEIFGLTTSSPPEQNIAIEQLGGLNHYNPAKFTPVGKRILPKRGGGAESRDSQPRTPGLSASGFHFRAPEDCETCNALNSNSKYRR